ncbi:DotD/TraH family lipoprotein, partial [Serratia sp. CY74664]|uniref:DotD/TraH family lipoprotein n=1 Tax=Serratia sp. CY74664 TaxID=3383676 RepID=UPI003FA125DD
MKFYCMLLFVPVVLSGCQLPAKSTAVMPLKNTDTQYNAEQIQNAQNNLYLSGAINQVRAPLFTPGISANSQRVTLNWDGDAVELLSHLARQRGLTFNLGGFLRFGLGFGAGDLFRAFLAFRLGGLCFFRGGR